MFVRRGLILLHTVAVVLPFSLIHANAETVQPSEQLQTYSANNLEHLIGTLNGGELPRNELSKLEIDYRARLAVANPKEKAVLQAAINICAIFDQIMDERAKAVGSVSVGWAANTNSLGSTRSAPFKDDKRAEIRGGQHDSQFVASAAFEALDKQWKERAPIWRNSVSQLLIKEKQAELAVAATEAPTPAVSPTAQTQSPPAAAPAQDPVIGDWWTESHNQITLNADHTMTGGRHGTWIANASADGKPVYELHFSPPKNWVDYLTLSADGKSLIGHTRGHADIGYYRQ